MAEKPKSSYVPKHVPKDAQVIVSIMKDMGITDYEPKVINQLLEFTYRYITSILDDSRIYANHGKKKVIDLDDVRLAVKLQLDSTFTNPPPRDVLIEVAKARNSVPLPFVKPSNGLRLPPDRYCLNNTNYRLKSPIKKPGKGGGYTTFGNQTRFKIDTHKGYSIVKRPSSFSTMARTQTISIPKPVVKLATNSVNHSHATKLQQSMQSQMTPLSEHNQPMMKMDLKESIKRKREEEDYDVP